MAITLFVGCSQHHAEVMKLAGDNKEELEKIFKYYKGDKMKLKYAYYLIDNMPGHATFYGKGIDTYHTMIDTIRGKISLSEIERQWIHLSGINSTNSNIHAVGDVEKINAAYLINNIEHAIKVVQSQPWGSEISESLFCKYILPYRVMNESLTDYRDTLYNAYQPLIKDVTDIKKAFSVIYHHVLDNFELATPEYPYTPDVLALHKLQSGTCTHRCIYLVCILRSLGIPTSYDYIIYWANYSQSGHSWVSLINENENTYSIFEKDSIPKQFNKIDASLLDGGDYMKENKDKMEINVYSKKKVSKIYRSSYPIIRNYKDLLKEKNRLAYFKNIHTEDVSDAYGLSGKIEITQNINTKYAFLYTFAAVKNWQPAAYTSVKGKKIIFEHLDTDVIYLPVIHKNENGIQPITYPILLQQNTQHEIIPDKEHLQSITLKRKYPLFGHWVRRGYKIVGGRFEGSHTADFKNPKLLHCIKKPPLHITKVKVDLPESFRYVRYLPPGENRSSIAETSYFTTDDKGIERLLEGQPIGDRIEKEFIQKAFDMDYSTYTETLLTYYWFGLDLGKNQKITRIEYCPKNDGNLICKGTTYELFYWDNQWTSLGTKMATCDSLIYENVPQNALLWLKCHAGGQEERIFTYEDGEQIWW
ncbi:MAG: discoidin domain-containing protein [Tannerella sp.]|jgi:hypothetical protein|nr:discoidin domain-containing protein [Tannerella sp.]